MDTKSVRTGLGKNYSFDTFFLLHSTQSSSLFITQNPLLSPPTAAAASSLYKRKTGLKKPQHSPSSQTSKISEKKKGMGNTSLLNQQFCSPPARSLTSPVRKQRRSIDSKDVKEALHLQRRRDPLSFGKPDGSLSAKGIRPNLRYFDEVCFSIIHI